MIDNTPPNDNIIPRQIEKSVRLDRSHSRDLVDTIRAGEKSNRRERKQKLDMADFTFRMRANLSSRYRGQELEERLKKCLDKALKPCRDIIVSKEPSPKSPDRKTSKRNMRSRRR